MNNVLIAGVLLILAGLAYYLLTEFFFLDLAGSGWKKAREEFPAAAQQLGLTLTAPKYDFHIGELDGNYRGYAVSIMPDKEALVQLDTGAPMNILLDTDTSHAEHGTSGLQAVNFGSVRLNDYFQTRFARSGMAARLAESERLADFVENFNSRWGRQVLRLKVENRYIRCYFPHGRARYIPAQHLAPILDDLTTLADILVSI